ncbi:rCG46018 [Rattus norvegicus]|uniref:RCG46018 n=1 Tax=Rattus norvegicus TaxID=10116 RepID=A6IDM5_RAT|nr:rCG46018 [Rattus norvegicus]
MTMCSLCFFLGDGDTTQGLAGYTDLPP